MTTSSSAFGVAYPPSLNTRNALLFEVECGLLRRPRSLSPWMFYDAHGSRLFERITQLPEYYLTRKERDILSRFAEAIIALARTDGGQTVRLLELGAGTASKTCILLNALRSVQSKTIYIPVDVSSDALDIAREKIASRLPDVSVEPIEANYFTHPPRFEAFNGTTLAVYLGSNIGNFSPEGAKTVLRNLRSQLETGDAALLGTDMAKDEKTLVAAYDDTAGATAAFNLNILRRLNRELGANFDLASYQHRVLWNSEESRVEMHLESRRDQHVRVTAAQLDLHFAQYETIHTENSYKFTQETIRALLEEANFEVQQSWTDEQGWYAVTLARAR